MVILIRVETLQETTTSSKIVNPERISRLFLKMCEGGMNGIIRPENQPNLGIRTAFHMVETSLREPVVYMTDISDKGIQVLTEGSIVQVEVVGMPTRVMFRTRIVKKVMGGVVIQMPGSLVSIERRRNARYRIVPRYMGYIQFSEWQADQADVASPPIFEQREQLASWCPLSDLSVGGACIRTQFPSALTIVQPGAVDLHAKLILPMIKPIELELSFRWQKRIRNRIHVNDEERYRLEFLFGVEFSNLDESALLKVRQFLRQLSLADAV